METILRIFNDLFPEPGGKGILAIGLFVGYFVTRRILQNNELSLSDSLQLIIPYGGGGAVITGLTSYLLEKKLFVLLDAYGIGLVAGFMLKILFLMLAFIFKGIGNLFREIGNFFSTLMK